MHERLFANQRALDPKGLSDSAQALGLDMTQFQQCLDSGKYAAKIREDLAEGQKAGVRGTPAFFLGLTDPKNPKVKVQRTISGAQAYSGFQTAIEDLLAGQK